ncbi:hypothetical protein S40285_04051 [Stachybotrys chlorohalonatus IBT 40285]|uniref:L-asparaginase II n=1 Tax=Stachybotrys chlorohalonatus (strain IBT 40285) TaxID=1283841 RepID=A0A084R099_STAC4|nr:hypothetical protein S40285_04051 [Stachybotrys chlorohalonata IBT 40285]
MTGIVTKTDLVISDRNGITENTHSIHAAVVDAKGRLLYSLGNPNRMTLIRSAAKPAQALAVVETGALEQFGFDEADLALMCASHNSEDRHVERARRMLAKSGATEDHLRCGSHPALSPVVNRQWIENHFKPGPIQNNCSGKHAGVLAGARALSLTLDDYHLLEHPMQVKVKQATEELSGLSPKDIKWGIDGCNMPSAGLPLVNLGRMYVTLAEAADKVESNPSQTPRTEALARVFNAMSKYPEMVGGEDRFCTILMGASSGQLIGKLGADGCYGIGIRGQGTKQLGIDGAIGLAVKVEDGNIPVLYAAVAEILEQLKLGTPVLREKLEPFHHLKTYNTAGVLTGQYSFQFELRKQD